MSYADPVKAMASFCLSLCGHGSAPTSDDLSGLASDQGHEGFWDRSSFSSVSLMVGSNDLNLFVSRLENTGIALLVGFFFKYHLPVYSIVYLISSQRSGETVMDIGAI